MKNLAYDACRWSPLTENGSSCFALLVALSGFQPDGLTQLSQFPGGLTQLSGLMDDGFALTPDKSVIWPTCPDARLTLTANASRRVDENLIIFVFSLKTKV